MQSTLVRIAVALFTFGLGVSATMFWIASRTPGVSISRIERVKHCSVNRHALPPLPPLPTVEALPPPPPALPELSSPGASVSISGEILQYAPLNLPRPTYPSLARAARADGTVVVRIVVGGHGHVESAKAVSGHPLLRKAALDAAYQSRFEPTLLAGNMGKVDGTLSYDFHIPE